ncbi:MAG TPA: DUF669 domain-containing protein [Desulfosporosinus sp.]|nr:DUF669 domain-containing protein [Desulfosporosinus sp.]
MSNLTQVFGQGFNVNSVEPQSDFDVLPPGKYPVIIDKAEVLQTKKRDGAYLKVKMTILEGPEKNRKLWDNINIANPSAKCVEIGLSELSALGRACGITVVSSEDQFLGKTCVACVKVKDGQNEIRTYKRIGEPDVAEPVTQQPVQNWTQPPTQYSQPPTQTPTNVASSKPATAKPPWAK